MVAKSRADYFKQRREKENLAQFNVTIDRNLYTALSEQLAQRNVTKRAWLEDKISEEINK